jgi:hypothetical protein
LDALAQPGTPLDKAFALGLVLSDGKADHMRKLAMSRSHPFMYFLKILLAPFTMFTSLLTYPSVEQKRVMSSVRSLFAPVCTAVMQYERDTVNKPAPIL